MKKIIKHIVLFILILNMSSCLDLQKDYDYEPQIADNKVNMTVWGYINARQDTLGTLKEAIELVSMEDYYSQSHNYTYALMTNYAFEIRSSSRPGVFQSLGVHTLSEINTEEKKEQLRNILKYHIIQGCYHGLGTLSFDPINVISLREGQDAVMTMKMNNAISYTTYSTVEFNRMAGTSSYVTAQTSNIFANNGVIHIVPYQIIYKP